MLAACFSADGMSVSGSHWQGSCSPLVHIAEMPVLDIYVQQGWRCVHLKAKNDENSDKEGPIASSSKGVKNDIVNRIANTRCGVHKRHYFNQPSTKVVSSTVTFHAPSNLLVVVFSTNIFGLWEMPAFSNIYTLSISQEKITSVAISPSGE